MVLHTAIQAAIQNAGIYQSLVVWYQGDKQIMYWGGYADFQSHFTFMAQP